MKGCFVGVNGMSRNGKCPASGNLSSPSGREIGTSNGLPDPIKMKRIKQDAVGLMCEKKQNQPVIFAGKKLPLTGGRLFMEMLLLAGLFGLCNLIKT